MSEPDTPQIGDFVIFTNEHRQRNAALVTNVDGPVRVRLAVFPVNGSLEYRWALRKNPEITYDNKWWASTEGTHGYWEPREDIQ